MSDITFDFGTWEAPSTVNPYLEVVAALASLDDETKSYMVVVHKSELLKTRNNLAKAANAVNKTARMRVNGETVIEDGAATNNVRFVITLTNMHKPRKGAKRDTMAEESPNTPDAMEAQAATQETATATPKPGK
jgi:hypothetical protein